MKILLTLTLSLLSLPAVIYAQGKVYSPLVDLSNGGQGSEVQTFEQYINFLYGFSIALAALLAVIKIVIAGAKYMLDDVITGKEQAKKDIQGAILGLLLILSAVIILELINPQLTERKIEFNDFQSAKPSLSVAVSVNTDGSVSVTGAPTNPDGSLKRPIQTVRTMSCYGNWCPKSKYTSWTGTVFSYNITAHCTDYVKEQGNLGRDACLLGIRRALTTEDISSWFNVIDNSHYGFCPANGARGTQVSSEGILTCQLPTRVENSNYFETKFNQQRAQRTAGDIANNVGGRNYDDEDDYQSMCRAESGTFVQVDSDGGVDADAESYLCAWYN